MVLLHDLFDVSWLTKYNCFFTVGAFKFLLAVSHRSFFWFLQIGDKRPLLIFVPKIKFILILLLWPYKEVSTRIESTVKCLKVI